MMDLIFYVNGFLLCVFAVSTALSRNIFHSAIWLTLTLLNVAGIYFFLGAGFLGTVQVLVYIGGIITLFIFAIKLTAHIEDQAIPQMNQQVFISAIVAIVIFIVLLKLIFQNFSARVVNNATAVPLTDIGKALIGSYALPFEFISVVLLAAMVGAIVIGRNKE